MTIVAGFGVRIHLTAPFRVEQRGSRLLVRLAESDPPLALDARALDPDVLDRLVVTDGPTTPSWRIETPEFACAWPVGVVLADDPAKLSPFLLHGPREALLWASGPVPKQKVLPIEQLADDAQHVREIAETEDGDARIDLAYLIDPRELDADAAEDAPPVLFWQRRYVIGWDETRAMVLSAQAMAGDEPEIGAALEAMERSLARPVRVLPS